MSASVGSLDPLSSTRSTPYIQCLRTSCPPRTHSSTSTSTWTAIVADTTVSLSGLTWRSFITSSSVATTPASLSSPTVAGQTSTLTSSPASTSRSADAHPLRAGSLIGIGVGISFSAMIVALVVLRLFRTRLQARSKRQEHESDGQEESNSTISEQENKQEKVWHCSSDGKRSVVHELEGNGRPAELSSGGRLVELEGD